MYAKGPVKVLKASDGMMSKRAGKALDALSDETEEYNRPTIATVPKAHSFKIKNNKENLKRNIVIVGAGWYGLHIYKLLKDKYNITILEKKKDIFDNSSNYNQNRLHLGYHYPRNKKTRNMCVEKYSKFINDYRDVVDFIDTNYYVVAKKSLIDFGTYKDIFTDDIFKHSFVKNNFLTNIDGDIFCTQEKIINSDRAKEHFKKLLTENNANIKFDYNVTSITSLSDNKIMVNNELECDYLFDCTYNQLNLSKKDYIYELTISLLYEKEPSFNDFEALTVMDGDFFSIYPRAINKKLYTLTHVKYTPIIKSDNAKTILDYKLKPRKVNEIRLLMEKDVKDIFPDFDKYFKYKSYFTSYKCKINSVSDSRECIIETSLHNNNIISINCGKIIGIYNVENYINNVLRL